MRKTFRMPPQAGEHMNKLKIADIGLAVAAAAVPILIAAVVLTSGMALVQNIPSYELGEAEAQINGDSVDWKWPVTLKSNLEGGFTWKHLTVSYSGGGKELVLATGENFAISPGQPAIAELKGKLSGKDAIEFAMAALNGGNNVTLNMTSSIEYGLLKPEAVMSTEIPLTENSTTITKTDSGNAEILKIEGSKSVSIIPLPSASATVSMNFGTVKVQLQSAVGSSSSTYTVTAKDGGTAIDPDTAADRLLTEYAKGNVTFADAYGNPVTLSKTEKDCNIFAAVSITKVSP